MHSRLNIYCGFTIIKNQVILTHMWNQDSLQKIDHVDHYLSYIYTNREWFRVVDDITLDLLNTRKFAKTYAKLKDLSDSNCKYEYLKQFNLRSNKSIIEK